MKNMKLRIAFIILIPIIVFAISLVEGAKIINPFTADEVSREILFSIRAPRSIIAILMGMALGASGAVLQGILKNPLADPYILGISSGASLAAAFGIIAGIQVTVFVRIARTEFPGRSMANRFAIFGMLHPNTRRV